jgi:hypothetical protein
LVLLRAGTLLVQIVQEARYQDDDFLHNTWEDGGRAIVPSPFLPPAGCLPWKTDPVPVRAVHKGAAFDLGWVWPCLERQFVSCTGEWWFVQAPLWFVFLIGAVWPTHYAVARLRALRSASGRKSAHLVDPCGRRRRGTMLLLGTGAVLSFLLLAVWLSSGWFWALYHKGADEEDIFEVELSRGTLCFRHVDSDASWPRTWDPFWDFAWNDRYELAWTVPHVADTAQSSFGHWQEIRVPLWTPFLLTFVPTALLARRVRRRKPPGHCQQCGYNLTGNVSGRCPECGTPCPSLSAGQTY